jgi:endonuclease/exonuclease/phosphatase family metal-dependent hydrolase
MTRALLPMFAAACAFAAVAQGEELTVAFWNCENLFDEFADAGHATATVPSPEDVAAKLKNLARCIKELDADIVGLAEVENRDILRRLCQHPDLKAAGYAFFVLLDETDERGIDTALISRRPFLAQSHAVPGFNRGVLAGRFSVKGEPLHVLVNHWKSRRGDALGTAATRQACADVVRRITEKDLPEHDGKPAKAIVVGDLNDDDSDPSVLSLEQGGLYANTLKDRPKLERWSLAYYDRDAKRVLYNGFDHILVTKTLREGAGLKWAEGSSAVVRFPYLIGRRKINNETYDWPAGDLGKRIGYSDHLPVRTKLLVP